MPVYEFFPAPGVKFLKTGDPKKDAQLPDRVYSAIGSSLQEFVQTAVNMVGVSGKVVYGKVREAPSRFGLPSSLPRNVVEISVAEENKPARFIGRVYGWPEHMNKAAIPT